MHVYHKITLTVLALITLGSCQRSCGDCWEDTKTCGRHMGRGMLALFGSHPEAGHPCSPDEFTAFEEAEFIPFADEDLYHGIIRGDELALMQIDADTAIPQSRIEVGAAIPGIAGFSQPMGSQLNLFRHIQFQTDDYTVRGAENYTTIRRIASQMAKSPQLYLFIEGHCDERGPAAYNLALGTRRANAIRNALIKEGVAPDRLLTISYGKERPLVTAHDAGAWKQNRRGQFKLHQHDGASVCVR